MYIGRNLSELNDLPISQWDMQELAYLHYQMGQMADLLNQQGLSFHQKIIKEIENRGGLPHYASGWNHSSEIIYD